MGLLRCRCGVYCVCMPQQQIAPRTTLHQQFVSLYYPENPFRYISVSESRSWAGILTFNPFCPCRSISAAIKIRFSRFSTSIQNNSCFLKNLSRFCWTASPELLFWRCSPQYRHAYERAGEMCLLTRSSRSGTSSSNTNDDSRSQILNRSYAFITSKQPFTSSSWCWAALQWNRPDRSR